jgi:diguanylate cyclase
VAVDRTEEILRQLERAGVEHLSWLMRVHRTLMFPERGRPIDTAASILPDLKLAAGCDAHVLAPMMHARSRMHEIARRLLAQAAATGERPDPEGYGAFMHAVEEYGREARRAEAHFRRALVETDPLTGVHNRQGMMRELEKEWMRAARTGQPSCIAIADLDYFKLVNDTYGHSAGDKVLCAAARFLKRRLRSYDMLYRFGGEEFLICLPDTDAMTARKVLDRLRSLMARVPVVLDDGRKLSITVSIGVAELLPGRGVEETIAAADRALYEAKDLGRNRVQLAAFPPVEAEGMPSLMSGMPGEGGVRH